MRYLITISYDGSKFSGFQRQKNANSVQNEIERALKKVMKKDIEIKGAGRTDAGVHAYGQRAHFDSETKIEPEKLVKVLNDQLNKYVYILDCIIVDDDFHARFSVNEKEYIYKIHTGQYSPTLEDYTLHLKSKININMMKKASKFLLGEHNFSSFVSGETGEKKSFIHSIKFNQYGDICYVTIKGTHFYRYMIRNIIGALLEVGKGKIKISKIKELIDDPQDKVVLPTASPNGLYLLSIKY